MTLPEWADKPVPTADLDVRDDAVGKLVVAVREVEAWLAVVAHLLGAAASPPEAARLRATQLVVKVRQRLDLVPSEDREDLRATLRTVSSLLALRNAVVHAMPRRFQRGDGREQDVRPPSAEEFTVEALVGAALAGRTVVAYFDRNAPRWSGRECCKSPEWCG